MSFLGSSRILSCCIATTGVLLVVDESNPVHCLALEAGPVPEGGRTRVGHSVLGVHQLSEARLRCRFQAAGGRLCVLKDQRNRVAVRRRERQGPRRRSCSDER